MAGFVNLFSKKISYLSSCIMKKKCFPFIAVLIMMGVMACKKSSSSSGSSLQGNWNFISEHVSGQNTTQYSSSGSAYKTITVSDYTTVGNAGILSISSNMMNASGISYFISDTPVTYNYKDDQLIDSGYGVVTQYVQPANYSVSYSQIGSDSVYFTSGSFISPSNMQAAGSGGAKINTIGDTLLTMTTYFSQDTSIFLYGMPATSSSRATLTSKFRKQ
jgi:hypothetical protein